MLKVYVSVLDSEVEVSEDGRISLPSGDYTPAELKKIAREVNKAMREYPVEDIQEGTHKYDTYTA